MAAEVAQRQLASSNVSVLATASSSMHDCPSMWPDWHAAECELGASKGGAIGRFKGWQYGGAIGCPD